MRKEQKRGLQQTMCLIKINLFNKIFKKENEIAKLFKLITK